MRILFVHQNFPGQYKHLAPALADSPGNEVVAIGQESNVKRVRGGLHPRIRLLAYPEPRGASKETHHYLHSSEAAVRRGQAVLRLVMELRKQGFVPDVICAHPAWGEALFLKDVYPDARILLYLEFFYRARGSDMNFDGEFPTSFDDQCRVRIRNATQLISLEAADAGLSPTRWQRDQYPKAFQGLIRVVHDGVQTRLVCPGVVDDFPLPGGGRLRSGDEVITYVARNLEPYRGFHVFMRALPAVLRARPEAQVLIVGGDEVSYGRRLPPGQSYREIFCREIGSALDASRVHFTGQLPYRSFLDVLRLSSAHVYLTYPFVLSWSLLEAMSCACPIIASDTAPVREVVETGRNGLLVDFFSATAVAEKIISVLADPGQMTAMRAQARRDIQAHLDLESQTLPRQRALVERLAAGPGVHPSRHIFRDAMASGIGGE